MQRWVFRAEVELRSRAEMLRLGCHRLAGGTGADLPEDWKNVDYIVPPGPAAEYANCRAGIRDSKRLPERDAKDTEAREFHQRMSGQHNMNTRRVNYKLKGGGTAKGMTVPEWTDVMLAGCVCHTIILERAPTLLRDLVRLTSRFADVV